MKILPFLTLGLLLVSQVSSLAAPAPRPIPVILDTDIGDDVDDAYALALLAASPRVHLLGVTTTFGQTEKRAQIAAKLLAVMGRKTVPVYAGRRGTRATQRQYEWARNFQSSAVKSEPAAAFMKREIERAPGQVTIIAIGPLTNLGDLLTRFPQTGLKIKRIVLMGGAVHAGYDSLPPPVVEWNIFGDPRAAQTVFESGVPLVMAGLEATAMMRLDAERQKKLFALGTPTTDALAALTALWGLAVPILFDPVAVAYALGQSHWDTERGHVTVDENGLTRLTDGPPNAVILVRPRKDEFLDGYVAALAPRGS